MMFACVVFLAAVASLYAAPEHMGEANLAKGHTSNNSTVYNGNADVMYEGISGNMEEAPPEQNGTKTDEEFSIYDKFRRFIQNFNKIITRLPIGTKRNVQNKLRDILLKYKRTEMSSFAAKNDDLIEKDINVTEKDIDPLNNSNSTINENGTESLQSDISWKTDVDSISYLINILSSENLDEKSRQFLKDLLDSSYLPANATNAVSPSLPPVHPSLFEFAIHGVKRERINKDKEEEEDESEEKGDENNDKHQKQYEDEKINSINLSFPVKPLSDMILFEDESPKKLSTEQNSIPFSQMTLPVTWNSPSSQVINVDKNKQQHSYPLDHPSHNTETLDVLTQLMDILDNQEHGIRPQGKERSPELNSDTLYEFVPLSTLLTEPISNTVGKVSVGSVPGSQPGLQISSTSTWVPTRPAKATPVKKQESDNAFLAGLTQPVENLDDFSLLTDILGGSKKYVEINEKVDKDSQEINDHPISEQLLNSNFPVNPILSTKHFDDLETKTVEQLNNLPVLHTKLMESPSELKSLDTFLAGTLERTQSLDAASHFKNIQDPGKEIQALENLLRLAERFSPDDENKKSESFQKQNNLFGNDNMFLQLLQDDNANKNTVDKGESESKEDVEPERFVGNENTNRFLLGSTGSGNDDTLSHISSTHLISALFPTEQQKQVNVIRFTGNHEEQIEKRNEENRKPNEKQNFLVNSDIKEGEFSQESEEDTNNGLSILSIRERERQLVAGNHNNKLEFDDEPEESVSSEVQDINSRRNLFDGNIESASNEIKRLMLSMDRKSYVDAVNYDKSKSSEEVGGKDISEEKKSNNAPIRNLQSSRESSLGSIDQDSFEQEVAGQDLSISAEQKSSNSVSSEKSNSVSSEKSLSEKRSSKSGSNEQDSSNSGSSERNSSNSDSSEQDSSNSGSSQQNSSKSRSSEQGSSNSQSSEQDSSNSESSEQDSSNSGSSKESSSNSRSSEQDSSNSRSSEQGSSSSDSSEQDSSNSDSSEQDSSNSGSSEGDSSNSSSSEQDSSNSGSSEQDSSNSDNSVEDSNSEDSEEGTRQVHGPLKLFESESSSSEEEQERPIYVIPRVDKPPILPQQPSPPPNLRIDDIIPPLIRPKTDEKFVPNLPDERRNDGKIPRDDEIIRNVYNRWNFDEGRDDYLNIFKPIVNDDDLFFAVQNIDISLPKELEDDTSYKKTYSEEKNTGYGYRSLKHLISEYYNDRKYGQRRYSSYLDDSYKRKGIYGNDVGYIQPTKYIKGSEDPYKYTKDMSYKGNVGYIQPTQYRRRFTYPEDSYGYRTEQRDVEYIQPSKHTRHSTYSKNMYLNNPRHMYRDSSRHPRHMYEDSRKHPQHMYESFQKHPRHMHEDFSGHLERDNAKFAKNTFNGQRLLKLTSNELNDLNQIHRATEHSRPHPFDAPLNRISSPIYPGRHPTMHDPFQDYIKRDNTNHIYRRNGGRIFHRGLLSTGLSDRRLHNTRLLGHRGSRYSLDRSFSRRPIFAGPR